MGSDSVKSVTLTTNWTTSASIPIGSERDKRPYDPGSIPRGARLVTEPLPQDQDLSRTDPNRRSRAESAFES